MSTYGYNTSAATAPTAISEYSIDALDRRTRGDGLLLKKKQQQWARERGSSLVHSFY